MFKKNKNPENFTYSDVDDNSVPENKDGEIKPGRLEADSEIYNKSRSDKLTSDDLEKMTFKQKLSIFKDYYLLPIIIVVVIVGVLGTAYYLGSKQNSRKTVYYCGMMDGLYFETEDSSDIINGFSDYINENSYSKVKANENNVFLKTFKGDFLDSINIDGAFDNHTFDSFILTSYYFNQYAGTGKLMDLNDVFTEEDLEKLGDRIVYVKDSNGDQIPMGIYLDDTHDFYRNQEILEPDTDKPIYAVPTCSDHLDMARYFILYYLDIK